MRETGFSPPTAEFWPKHGLVEDIRPTWRRCTEAGEDVVLATLVGADGSAPRRIGSQMIILGGDVAGYVSGGCVEANIAEFAKCALSSGKPDLISLGAGSRYVDIKLPCGSRIDVVLDPVRGADKAVSTLFSAEDDRAPVVWTGNLENGAHECLSEEVFLQQLARFNATTGRGSVGGKRTESGFLGDRYWKAYAPRRRLVVNGRDPIALALAALASAIGAEVVLNAERGPSGAPGVGEMLLRRRSAQELLAEFRPDRWTAIVTTTHDMEEDHEILKLALPSPCFYVGALGSRRHLPGRLAMLRHELIHEDALRRLSAPVGLDIKASTPFEIAIAILADIIKHANH